MNKNLLTLLAVLSVSASAAIAQVAPTAPPKGGPNAPVPTSPEVRAKFSAAYQKIVSNPEFIDARKNFTAAQESFQAVNKKLLLEADPTLAPELDKMEAQRKAFQQNHARPAAAQTAPAAPAQ